MHQSFVAPAPLGPRNSGAFNFSIFKAVLKALHCRAKFVVKSPLKAPAPGADKIKIKNNNRPESIEKIFSPIPWWSHVNCVFSWLSDFKEFEHTHVHTHIKEFFGIKYCACSCILAYQNTTA